MPVTIQGVTYRNQTLGAAVHAVPQAGQDLLTS